MSTKLTRRDFLTKSAVVIGGTSLLGGSALLSGCSPKQAAALPVIEIPNHPYAYAELDAERVEKLAYEGYFEEGCCFGVSKALLTELSDKIGFPYTAIPPQMFANGKEGYGAQTLCGALGGAVGVIGLCLEPKAAREVTAQLFKWYTTTNLPIYQPEQPAPVQTISASVNCDDSVSLFKQEANVEHSDDIRRRRCGGVSGDVARKTAELLNIHFGYAEAPVEEIIDESVGDNQYIGVGKGFNEADQIKVRVTMDGDKIANIEVLSHGETSGISDPAFKQIPQAIIDAQSTDLDVVSGATYTSKGIIAAVNDALSQVKS